MTDDEFSAEELERQRRRRLIDQAKDTVARLKNREKYREEVESLPPAEVARRLIPAPEDPVAKWRREMAAIAEAHAAEAAELSTRSGAGDLIDKTNENAAVVELGPLGARGLRGLMNVFNRRSTANARRSSKD